jgi:hypothetical protein
MSIPSGQRERVNQSHDLFEQARRFIQRLKTLAVYPSQVRMVLVNEAHMKRGDRLIRDILDCMRRAGRGGRPGRAELLTGIAIRTNPRPDAPRGHQPPGAADRGDGRAPDRPHGKAALMRR